MNQDMDGITVLNSGNYKILFGRQFYTNTRMGNHLVFEYKFPHTYMGQNCNNNEENKKIEQNPKLQYQMQQMQQMQPIVKCSSVKYIYLYLTPNGLQHEESMNPYPDIPNPHADQILYQNKQLKLALYRQWKIVMIIDATIIGNINMEYQKSKEEFFEKMKELKEMRMKRLNPFNRN
jgi:hypothetical protein